MEQGGGQYWGLGVKSKRFRFERERGIEHDCSRKARACARVPRPWGEENGHEYWELKDRQQG